MHIRCQAGHPSRMEMSRRLEEAYTVGRAVVRVIADSTKTSEIHRVEEITGRPRYRAIFAELAASPDAEELLEDRPELSSDHVDYAALRKLPASTLGGAYVRHLDRNGLSADYQAAATRHVDDPDLAYLMRRFRQTHDVWHAMLDLGIHTGHEEVLTHWFSYGQLRLPVSAMNPPMFVRHAEASRPRAPLGSHASLADGRVSRRPRCGAAPRRLLGAHVERPARRGARALPRSSARPALAVVALSELV